MRRKQSAVFSIRGRPTTRVRAYLSRLTRFLALVALVAAAVALVQAVFHPIETTFLETADTRLAALDRTLNADLVSGVSLGTLLVIAAVAAVAVLGRGVHRRQYVVSFWRGLLSSAIFLLSDTFYRFVRERGRLYYTASVALFIAVMLILVELLARWGSYAEERERRTEFLASIVSGLCFALLVQAGEAFLKHAGSSFLAFFAR